MAYIGFFPITNVGAQAVRFRQQTLTKKTETASGRIIRATTSTTKWKGTISFPPMTRAEFQPIQAFISRCQGPLNEFDLVIPTVSTSSSEFNHGVGALHIDAGASADAGATSIAVNCGTGPTNVLKAGDVIRFHNHSKVYMVTEDVDSDATGDATINFQPGLVTAVSDDSAADDITAQDVPLRMILTNDLQEFAYRTDGLVEYEIDVEEVI